MDSERFDALARRLATEGTSRRRMLRGMGGSLGGAALAALGMRAASAAPGGGNSTCAQWCHEHFSGREAGQCTSAAARGVGPCYGCAGRMGPPRPPASDQCHDVVCNGQTGQWGEVAKADGTSCNDDLCSPMTCQDGVCVSGAPVVCTAIDQCHDVGVCNPNTGECSNPAKEDGTSCDDGNACTTNDTCQGGVCVGGDPVVCEASDQCHDVGICDPATGLCSDPVKDNGTSCDDGDPCTVNDTCQEGVCTGEQVVCEASDQCHEAGTCNPTTAGCTAETLKPYGTPCNDGNELCNNDICCPTDDGYVAINGGCFKIAGDKCAGCNVDACYGSVDGAGAWLCGLQTAKNCKSNANCPEGTACWWNSYCIRPDR